jgi:hypothetical protein
LDGDVDSCPEHAVCAVVAALLGCAALGFVLGVVPVAVAALCRVGARWLTAYALSSWHQWWVWM